MNPTKIQYCDYTWNPITGCSPVSTACDNCWARRMSVRLKGRFGYDKDNPFRPTFHPDRLTEPLRRKRPAVIAVGFMGDVCHPDQHPMALGKIMGVMAEAWWHQFLLLTKRPDQLLKWSEATSHYPRGDRNNFFPVPGWPDNVWLGVSVENQETANARIPELLKVPGGRKWVSMEPLLGPVDLDIDIGQGIGDLAIDRLEWVVVGCESGPGHRGMAWMWAAGIQGSCRSAGVPFMLKQQYRKGKLVSLPGMDDGDPCDDNPVREALTA